MDIPADQYELYVQFGIAAEKAQVLEVEAGNVALSYLTTWVKIEEITPEVREMFRSIVDDCNRSTLGKLLKQIRSIGTFDDSIIQAVDTALERRNYLMHHFFRTHNFAIFNEAGRKEMLEELRDIQGKLDHAHAILFGISKTLDKIASIDDSSEQALIERLQAQGKRVGI